MCFLLLANKTEFHLVTKHCFNSLSCHLIFFLFDSKAMKKKKLDDCFTFQHIGAFWILRGSGYKIVYRDIYWYVRIFGEFSMYGTFYKVLNAARSLQKPGPHRQENLRTLRQAFSQGTAYIDTFFKYALNLLNSFSLLFLFIS